VRNEEVFSFQCSVVSVPAFPPPTFTHHASLVAGKDEGELKEIQKAEN
jgi:hypothetical protein